MADSMLFNALSPEVREHLMAECAARPLTVVLAAVGEMILGLHQAGVPRAEIRDRVLHEIHDPETQATFREKITPRVVDLMLDELLDPSPVDEVLAELDAHERRPSKKRRKRRP